MDTNNKILTQAEIYKSLAHALIEKIPTPPDRWCPSKLDEEVRKATREYEPIAWLRQNDALETSLNYLVDFASRMPERVNLGVSNNRVQQICENLSAEIVRITIEPELVINERGKLKSWLKAILAVETCLIYREETERHIAEKEESKRFRRIAQLEKITSQDSPKPLEKWKSALAKTIFLNASRIKSGKISDQPSLF